MIALAALALTGCKFFENNSPSALEPKQIFADEMLTEQAIFAVYNSMGENNSYRNRIACGYSGLNTDIEWSSSSTSSSDGEKPLVQYDCGLTNARVNDPKKNQDIWSYLNTMVERCNNIIEGLEEYGNVNQNTTMAYFLGEAYFLRSWTYLEMLKIWGDVPARFESVAKNPESVSNPKVDRNEIYEHLRIDLARAAELMPWSEEIPAASARNNIGRPSKAAALALLARVDLMYAGKAVRPGATGRDVKDPTAYALVYNIEDPARRAAIYAEVLNACAQVINHDKTKLAPDFQTPFRQICMGKTTYSEMEHIWALPFNLGARGQVLNYNAAKVASDMLSVLPGVLPGIGTGASSNGRICINPYLLQMFEEGDTRLNVTLFPGQWTYDKGDGESKDADVVAHLFPRHDASAKKLYMKHAGANSLYCGKYRFEWYGEGGNTLTGTDDGVAFPILRYADVLLMFAEAEIGGISGDVPVNNTGLIGVQQFNKVRERAHVATVTAVTMADIDKERALEFCGEYIRKYDLMRWGILQERMVSMQDFITNLSKDDTRKAMNIGDSIYYKYTWHQFNAEQGGYEMDSIYGFRPGENTRLPYMTKENGWQAKDIYNSDSKGYLLNSTNFPIYKNEQQLLSRQYWPIFLNNVTAAGPDILWNNYGYGQ